MGGEKTGRSLEVDPTRVEVIIDQLALLSFDDPAVRERAGRVRFIGPAGRIVEDPEDDEDDMEPLLAPQALERLGPVDSGQVYGFVLPPALGGQLSVDNLRIVDAQTYLTLQAQQDEITVSDPVGANWGQVSTLIGADPVAPPVEQMGEENGGAAGAGQGDAGSAIPWHMVPEPSDPAAQDALTDEVIDHDLLGPGGANLKPMGVAVPVPEEYFERMAVFVPRSVLRVWRRFGFEGFGDGLFWITSVSMDDGGEDVAGPGLGPAAVRGHVVLCGSQRHGGSVPVGGGQRQKPDDQSRLRRGDHRLARHIVLQRS